MISLNCESSQNVRQNLPFSMRCCTKLNASQPRFMHWACNDVRLDSFLSVQLVLFRDILFHTLFFRLNRKSSESWNKNLSLIRSIRPQFLFPDFLYILTNALLVFVLITEKSSVSDDCPPLARYFRSCPFKSSRVSVIRKNFPLESILFLHELQYS